MPIACGRAPLGILAVEAEHASLNKTVISGIWQRNHQHAARHGCSYQKIVRREAKRHPTCMSSHSVWCHRMIEQTQRLCTSSQLRDAVEAYELAGEEDGMANRDPDCRSATPLNVAL